MGIEWIITIALLFLILVSSLLSHFIKIYTEIFKEKAISARKEGR